MIECHYKWCSHHFKDEPFCNLMECVASEDNLLIFEEKHAKEKERYEEYLKETEEEGSDGY